MNLTIPALAHAQSLSRAYQLTKQGLVDPQAVLSVKARSNMTTSPKQNTATT